MAESLSIDRKVLRETLRETISAESELSTLAIKFARILHDHTSPHDIDVRHRGIRIIRDWSNYLDTHEPVADDDPYLIRERIEQFATHEFAKSIEHVPLNVVDIADVSADGKSYTDIIADRVHPAICHDPDVAIYGGAARLALKIHAGVDIASELPISDIDILVSNDADKEAKSRQYGSDLAGTKGVNGIIAKTLPSTITNFDCTMNQVAVHDGKLFYSDQALADIIDGNIRLIAKDDPLFGTDSNKLPDGNIYLNQKGFYRGLSFLLRGKGDRLIVSAENLEAEKGNIGKYWLTTLFVKIMPMKDQTAKELAIANWHDVAQRIGSTQTTIAPKIFSENYSSNSPK